jgi:hypothetical protein
VAASTGATTNPRDTTNTTADHHAMEIETPAFPCPDDVDVCYGGGDKVDDASIADMSCSGFIRAMEDEMSRTFVEGDALLEKEESMPPRIAALIRQYPKISMKGNEWMDEAFRDTKRAELTDIASSFSDLDNMRLFWVAEHASPPGRCGGGLRYLVARTFQNAKADAGLDVDRIPDFPEARWHIDSFIQYHSMSEPQRRRQARITKTVMDHVQQQSGTFFKDTFIPEYKDLARMYGKTGKQSLWNILPIPPVEDLGGVAYVSPIHIVKFLFANGVPVDDIVVNSGVQSDNEEEEEDKRVFHVADTTTAKQWLQEIIDNNKSSPEGEKKEGVQRAVCLWGSDWKDGFGPSRVKNNRGSVDAWTLTISAPKHLINATDNTFLMAIGLKKSKKGWREVQHRFKEDMGQLSKTTDPVTLYHGDMQKMAPTFAKHFAHLADKQERPEGTCTMGCTSTIYRIFGVVGQIYTPKCKVKEAKVFFKCERKGHASGWGWCDAFIDKTEKLNGANLPSCRGCRLKRLVALGILPTIEDEEDKEEAGRLCKHCIDWSPLPNDHNCNLLDFKVPQGYLIAQLCHLPVERFL